MSKALEMALRLFSPKGALHEPTFRNFSALGRDDAYSGEVEQPFRPT
ncbi:hypothetical protein ACET7Y_20525 [Aeromonas veronii]